MDTAFVVDGGMAIITNRIKGAGSEPLHIGWGTGTTTAATPNTALETPRAEARTEGTSTRETTSSTNDTYQVVGTITCASTPAAITEVGLFDAATDGNLFLRATFSAINVSVGDSVAFTLKTQFNQGS
jgi:hypothetical protein